MDVAAAVMIYLILLMSVFMVITVSRSSYVFVSDHLGDLVRASAIIMVILAVIYVIYTKRFIGYMLDISALTVIPLHYMYLFSIPKIMSLVLLPFFNLLKGVTVSGKEYSLLSMDFAQLALLIIILRHRKTIINKLKALTH